LVVAKLRSLVGLISRVRALVDLLKQANGRAFLDLAAEPKEPRPNWLPSYSQTWPRLTARKAESFSARAFSWHRSRWWWVMAGRACPPFVGRPAVC